MPSKSELQQSPSTHIFKLCGWQQYPFSSQQLFIMMKFKNTGPGVMVMQTISVVIWQTSFWTPGLQLHLGWSRLPGLPPPWSACWCGTLLCLHRTMCGIHCTEFKHSSADKSKEWVVDWTGVMKNRDQWTNDNIVFINLQKRRTKRTEKNTKISSKFNKTRISADILTELSLSYKLWKGVVFRIF